MHIVYPSFLQKAETNGPLALILLNLSRHIIYKPQNYTFFDIYQKIIVTFFIFKTKQYQIVQLESIKYMQYPS